MKRIASHLCTLLVGMVAVAGHFMLTQWLFGQTVAIICIIQIVSSNDQM